MSFTTSDYEQLQKLMDENPQNKELIQKLLDSHQYTISKISHEIRNPLALVYSTLQLIESQHPETKSFKYWDQMHSDIEFMISLLADLSTFNNGEQLHLEELSSRDFLSCICLSFAAAVSEDSIEFTSYIPDDLSVLSGDKLKLNEVLMNLLKNAKEALSPGGKIFLRAYEKEHLLHIEITDTGCGIPPEYLDTIFNTFVTHKSEGTGLGLAISKRIIDAHGGAIHVTSKVNEGSTFTITLPVA